MLPHPPHRSYLEFDHDFIFLLAKEWADDHDYAKGHFHVYSRQTSELIWSADETEIHRNAWWYQLATDKAIRRTQRSGPMHSWQAHQAIPLGPEDKTCWDRAGGYCPRYGAVQPDEDTGCLCLASDGHCLLIIPDYKAVFRSGGEVKAEPIALGQALPTSVDEDGSPYNSLSVGASRAAFVADVSDPGGRHVWRSWRSKRR